MKNRTAGLGIITLIFFLTLLFKGVVEAEKPPCLALCIPEGISQQQDLAAPVETSHPCGILQLGAESNKVHHVVRKFPAGIGVLFMLRRQKAEANSFLTLAANLSISHSKDRSLYFHCLRI